MSHNGQKKSLLSEDYFQERKNEIVLVGAKRTEIQEEYTVQAIFGSGGFSTVYTAVENCSGDVVAIKHIIKYREEPDRMMPWDLHKQYLTSEVQTLLRLSGCSNVVQLFDIYEDPSNIYMIFELIDGEELFDMICANGFYSEPEAKELLRAICRGLRSCHERNVMHRDIKPENIMCPINDSNTHDLGKATIIDFGLAAVLEPGSYATEASGSPGYVAPEILVGCPYDKAVDMWSLGVTAYILLAGYPPWVEDIEIPVEDQIIAGDYEFHSPEWDDISDEAKDWIRKLLVLDPTRRMTVAEALQHPFLKFDAPVPKKPEFELKNPFKQDNGPLQPPPPQKAKPAYEPLSAPVSLLEEPTPQPTTNPSATPATEKPVIEKKPIEPHKIIPLDPKNYPQHRASPVSLRFGAYKPPDHISHIPVIKDQPQSQTHKDYKPPDHISHIPVIKDQPQSQAHKDYKPPDHISHIPVIKDQPQSQQAHIDYKPPDHISHIPVIKDQPQSQTHKDYKPPDHISHIPVIKEQAQSQTQPQTQKDYKPPDHISHIPVIKEQAQPQTQPQTQKDYKPPDHISHIPVIKEQAQSQTQKDYKPPDHISHIPVIKDQPQSQAHIDYKPPDHISHIPVIKDQPQSQTHKDYKPPDHISHIPVIKDQPQSQVHKDYKPPDHISHIPVIREQAQSQQAQLYKPPNHISHIPVIREQAGKTTQKNLPKYIPPDHTRNIPVVREIWDPETNAERTVKDIVKASPSLSQKPKFPRRGQGKPLRVSKIPL